MIAIWDDHEFSDDCWRDHQTYTNANLQQTARRRAASQAWAEYMPVDWGDVSFDLNKPAYDNLRIYRDFRFGTLLHLVMTDERLYRDDHVVNEAAYARLLGHDPENGDDAVGARYFVPEPVLRQFEIVDTAVLGRTPSILGPTQAQWWKDTLAASTAAWKVWGNEVTLNRMWLDLGGALPPPLDQLYVVNADSWDGFPSHRAELLGWLRSQGIRNVVAITGDLHGFLAGVLYDNADPATGASVGVDFVSAGISSASFYQYVRARAGGSPLAGLLGLASLFDQLLRRNNPALAYADLDAQGYAVATVTPGAFSVVYTKVKALNPDGSKPASPLAKSTRITLETGSTVLQVEDNIG
jgi:alkaline phosphatase D